MLLGFHYGSTHSAFPGYCGEMEKLTTFKGNAINPHISYLFISIKRAFINISKPLFYHGYQRFIICLIIACLIL